MTYKFEKLEVWKLAMKVNALVYELTEVLPEKEKFNSHSQMRRASTSISLNIAEGSTGQNNAERTRFLSFAIRSYVEVIACLRIVEERKYLIGHEKLKKSWKKLALDYLPSFRFLEDH